MSPEDESEFEKLAKAERVIKALEALASECTSEGLAPFEKRIRDCMVKCQNDYVALHRALFEIGAGKAKRPRGTRH